jgi:hypothetical protein
MPETFAFRVADLIDAEAHSGSGSWDELHGPDAVLTQVSNDKYAITIPTEYDDEGNPSEHVCVITVECGAP